MKTGKNILLIVVAVSCLAATMGWFVDVIEAGDSGDVTITGDNATNTGPSTTSDASTTFDVGSNTFTSTGDNVLNVGDTATTTTTNTTTNTTTEGGYGAHSNIYLGGYGYGSGYGTNAYGIGTGYARVIDDRLQENTRLLLNIEKKIDALGVRLARIEKALNIESSAVVEVKPTQVEPKSRPLRYNTN